MKGKLVESSVGRFKLDDEGSPVGVARIDPAEAYGPIPELLQAYINEDDHNAWEKVKQRIDYIFAGVGRALDALNEETRLEEQVRSEVDRGKKLLFKPNLVALMAIDPVTHGEGNSNPICTQWPFVAALMRWFHDRLGISYHQMSLGEAGTAVTGLADVHTQAFGNGRTITPEALIEGKWGEGAYGGWGFYFVRKYLAERHEADHDDDPMRGFAESVSGEYVPPGRAGNRLLVYDLNRVSDIPSKRRDVPVPDGVNFKEITLHKAVVGGDPSDPADRADYPGCVLVNVPRFKVHIQALFTNVIKNLGIGLYPMLVTEDGDPQSGNWKYCLPYGPIPRLKDKIPHYVWFPKFEPQTGLPMKDANGEFVVRKTGGLSGTIVDMLKAVQNQGVLMVHVVDAVEAINLCHDFFMHAAQVPEGYAFAGLDPVALDLFCARYMFKNVPMAEAKRLRAEGKVPADFVQRVPAPYLEGQNIVNGEGFDAPVARYELFRMAEERGLGRQAYHVVGWDTVAGGPLASLQGHLGRVDGETFLELVTSTLYFDIFKLLWDLQTTILGYVRASDRLTGSAFLQELMAALDENGDGILDYNETGKRRLWGAGVLAEDETSHATDNFAYLRRNFNVTAQHLRYNNRKWNPEGRDFSGVQRLINACATAFHMSQAPAEAKDPIYPGTVWGQGKWPSLQYAYEVAIGRAIFGPEFPGGAGLAGLYGQAFLYADQTLNAGRYISGGENQNSGANLMLGRGQGVAADALSQYLGAASAGAAPLAFVLYVPKGYGRANGRALPNIEETEDPAKVFTAEFNGGREVW